MAKKLIFNVLYNLVIFICLVAGYQYGVLQKRYGFIVAAVFIIAIFVVLKIRLIKEVKRVQKP